MKETVIEKRKGRVSEMQIIVDTVKAEKRAMTADELDKYYSCEDQINKLDAVIET